MGGRVVLVSGRDLNGVRVGSQSVIGGHYWRLFRYVKRSAKCRHPTRERRQDINGKCSGFLRLAMEFD